LPLLPLARQQLGKDPFSGQLFVFRGRRGDLVKVLSWDGQGLCLYAKRLEKGRFVWPQAKDGTVSLTAAQLSASTGERRCAHGTPRWRDDQITLGTTRTDAGRFTPC
jgi:transposase